MRLIVVSRLGAVALDSRKQLSIGLNYEHVCLTREAGLDLLQRVRRWLDTTQEMALTAMITVGSSTMAVRLERNDALNLADKIRTALDGRVAQSPDPSMAI
jgi:hypothetical protein